MVDKEGRDGGPKLELETQLALCDFVPPHRRGVAFESCPSILHPLSTGANLS